MELVTLTTSFLSPTDLFLLSTSLVMGASLVVALSRTWQVALLAFWAQYIGLGILALEPGPPARGGMRILAGSLICLVLYLTARRTEHERAVPVWPVVDRRWVSQTVFRLAAVGVAGVGVFGSSLPTRISMLPPGMITISIWLMVIGVVIMLISSELLWVGMGLLSVESGFETLYTMLDPRLWPAGILAAGGLLLALGVVVVVTALKGRTISGGRSS